MIIRLDAQPMCECGTAMMFIDPPETRLQRRMTCPNRRCEHFGRNYLEPSFSVEEAEDDMAER
jgi:hypothetical protein